MAANIFPSLVQFKEQLEFQAGLLDGSLKEDQLRRLDPEAVFRDAIQGEHASSEDLKVFLTELKNAKKSSAANPEPAARATEQTHESSPNSASQAASETRPGGPKGSTIRPLQPAAPHTAPVNKPQLLTAPTTLHVPQISATTAQQQHADRKSPDEAINTNSPEAVQPAGCANSRIALLPSILLDERVCRRISRREELHNPPNPQTEILQRTEFRERLYSLCQSDKEFCRTCRSTYERIQLRHPKSSDAEIIRLVVQIFMENAKNDVNLFNKIWSHVPVPFPDPMTMLGKRESPTPAHTNGKSSQSAAPLKQRKRSKKAAGRGGTGAATVPPAQAQQPHAASQVPGTVCNTSTTRVGPVQLGSSGPGPQSAAAPAVAVAGQGGHTQGNMMNVLQHTAHAQAEPAAPQGQPSTIKTAVYSQQQQAVSSETGDMNTFVFHEALRCMAHHDPTIQNIWVQTGHQQHALFPELSESELQPYILNAVLHRLKFDAANRSKVWVWARSMQGFNHQQQQPAAQAACAWGMPAQPQPQHPQQHHHQPQPQPQPQQCQPQPHPQQRVSQHEQQLQQVQQPQLLPGAPSCAPSAAPMQHQQLATAAGNTSQQLQRPELVAAPNTDPRLSARRSPQTDTAATTSTATAGTPQGSNTVHTFVQHQSMHQAPHVPHQVATQAVNSGVGANNSGQLQKEFSGSAYTDNTAPNVQNAADAQPPQMPHSIPMQQGTHCGAPSTPVKPAYQAQRAHMSPTTPDMHAQPTSAAAVQQNGCTQSVLLTGRYHEPGTVDAERGTKRGCVAQGKRNERGKGPSTPDHGARRVRPGEGEAVGFNGGSSGAHLLRDAAPATPDLHKNPVAVSAAVARRTGRSPNHHKGSLNDIRARSRSSTDPRPDFSLGAAHQCNTGDAENHSLQLALQDLVGETHEHKHSSSAELLDIPGSAKVQEEQEGREECNAQTQADSARSSAEDVATGVAIPPDSGSPPQSAPFDTSLSERRLSGDLGATPTPAQLPSMSMNAAAHDPGDVGGSEPRDYQNAAVDVANGDQAYAAAAVDAIEAANASTAVGEHCDAGGLEYCTRSGRKRSFSRVEADSGANNNNTQLRINPPRAAAHGAAAAMLQHMCTESSERTVSVDADAGTGAGAGASPPSDDDFDVHASQPSQPSQLCQPSHHVSSQPCAATAAVAKATSASSKRSRKLGSCLRPGRKKKLRQIANRKARKSSQSADAASGPRFLGLPFEACAPRQAGTIAFQRRACKGPSNPSHLEADDLQHRLEGKPISDFIRREDGAQHAASSLISVPAKLEASDTIELAKSEACRDSGRNGRGSRDKEQGLEGFATDAASAGALKREKTKHKQVHAAATAAAQAGAPARQRRKTGGIPFRIQQLPDGMFLEHQQNEAVLSPRDCPNPMLTDLTDLVPDNFCGEFSDTELTALLQQIVDDADMPSTSEGAEGKADAPRTVVRQDGSSLQVGEDCPPQGVLWQDEREAKEGRASSAKQGKKAVQRSAAQPHTGATKKAKKNSVPVRKHQGLHYEARKVFTEPPDCLTDDDKHIVDAACISREARDVVELESHICALQEKAKGMTKHTEKWRILKNYRIAYLKQVVDQLNRAQPAL